MFDDLTITKILIAVGGICALVYAAYIMVEVVFPLLETFLEMSVL